MSVKKNLTVATLAALLAVPAFSANNTKASANTMPSMTPSMYKEVRDPHVVAEAPHNTDTRPFRDNVTEGYLGNKELRIGPDGSYTVIGTLPSSNAQVKNTQNQNNNAQGNNQNNTPTNSNNSTQYISKKELPQTGEVNNDAKVASIGAMALASGMGLTALSIAKKHKQMALEENINTKPSVDNGNNNPEDSTYHLIMSNAFNNISKHLNN